MQAAIDNRESHATVWVRPQDISPDKGVIVAAIFADGTLFSAARHDDGWWSVETPYGERHTELDSPPLLWAPLPKLD